MCGPASFSQLFDSTDGWIAMGAGDVSESQRSRKSDIENQPRLTEYSSQIMKITRSKIGASRGP